MIRSTLSSKMQKSVFLENQMISRSKPKIQNRRKVIEEKALQFLNISQ